MLIVVPSLLLLAGCQSTSGVDPQGRQRGAEQRPALDPQQRLDPYRIRHRSSAELLPLVLASAVEAAPELWLELATAYQAEQNWQASAAVLSQLQAVTLNPPALAQQRTLLLARFAAHQGYWPRVDQLLQPWLQQPSSEYALAMLSLASDSAIAQQQWQRASDYQLRMLSHGETDFDPETLWQLLRQVPQPQQLQPRSDAMAAGWRQLVLTLHAGIAEPERMALRLQSWQQDFPRHPAQAIAARLQQPPMPQQQQVLVLLPLSGPFAEQGQAVLDGMVMHLSQQQQLRLQAIDSHQLDFAKVPELLQQYQAELLVGPLLRDDVAALAKVALPERVSWLSLNTLSSGLASSQLHAQFALDPETEVRQAAQYLATRGYQQPLLFAPDSSRGQQHEALFRQQWQQLKPQQTVHSSRYRSTDDMKEAVQAQLGVSASEARINAVKIAAGRVIVDAQARSRADLDVIYLVGGVEQTRLLKPFIDVNIAAFMEPLPVYANSGSHSANDAISENDLNEVHFSEAPWLLPNHPQQDLLQQWLSLRRGWGYPQARLAAFGHDSLLLLPRLRWLRELPGAQLEGLTGRLSIAADGSVQRQLSWAKFSGHEVQPLTP